MNPREFVLHWHAVARLAAPRFIPDGWLRQADALMGKGITPEDLTLVAKWMLTQLGLSQSGERNSVAFNAASFPWRKMFGEFGASDEHERFVGLLALAEAARKPSARAVQAPCTAAAESVNEAAAQASRERAMREFREKFGR